MSASPTLPLVYIVVLNWNGYDDTHECLLSLRTVAYGNYRVLVVDNASQDDSPARLQRDHPELELVQCPANHGIATGYNYGIQAALARGADYVVVMNNDVVVDPAYIAAMLDVQRRWNDCGVVMPKIYYYNEPDVIWSAGGYLRWRWLPGNIIMRGKRRDSPRYQHEQPLEFAPSCCLLLTRDVCQQVAFDEAYFFYYDDWDFCVQARQAGYQLVFAPAAKLWHKVSRSTQNSVKGQRWWRILGQSCVRYHRKHHGTAALAAYVLWVVLRETAKGNLRHIPVFLAGIRSGLHARTVADMRPGWSI